MGRSRGTIAAFLAVVAVAGSAAPALAAAPVALFDEGHSQQFLAGRDGALDLSGLAEVFREAGLEVRVSRGPLDDGALAGVSALVISGPFAPLAPGEIAAVRRFVEGGGRLAVMIHVSQPVLGLLVDLGLQVSRGPIHETDAVIAGRGTDFAVTRFEPHPLTDGLERLAVFGCWGLRSPDDARAAIARTGPRAWIDSNRDGQLTRGEPVEAAGVLVAGTAGRGAFAVYGDDAIFQNRFLRAHNLEPARRLARWLSGGRPSVFDL